MLVLSNFRAEADATDVPLDPYAADLSDLTATKETDARVGS
jgi:hypothetical protein